MSCIHGTSQDLSIDKIYMEEGYKASVQQQRTLNPLMKDAVSIEIIKWLDAGIVYQISYSK